MDPISVGALIISGCMLLISVVTFIINNAKSSKNDTKAEEGRLNDINQSLLKVNMKLDQVCTTTSEIRTDIKTMQTKQIEHTEQIAVLTGRVDTAFMRIDELRAAIQDLQKGVK